MKHSDYCFTALNVRVLGSSKLAPAHPKASTGLRTRRANGRSESGCDLTLYPAANAKNAGMAGVLGTGSTKELFRGFPARIRAEF